MQIHVHNGRIGQTRGEIVLLLAFGGSTPPVQFHLRQHFTGSQRAVHQRNHFVQRHGKWKMFWYTGLTERSLKRETIITLTWYSYITSSLIYQSCLTRKTREYYTAIYVQYNKNNPLTMWMVIANII